MGFGPLPHLGTALGAAVCQRQKAADFFQGEAKFAHPHDEPQPRKMGAVINLVTGRRARRIRHHADVLVITYGLPKCTASCSPRCNDPAGRTCSFVQHSRKAEIRTRNRVWSNSGTLADGGVERAGVARGLTDIPEARFYRLLSSLPSRDVKPELASRLYLQLLEGENFEPEKGGSDRATFLSQGTPEYNRQLPAGGGRCDPVGQNNLVGQQVNPCGGES